MELDALVERGREEAKKYVDGGWRFVYEPDTRFVGVFHPKGGKQSICEVSFWPVREPRDVLGYLIADALNNADALEAERSARVRLEEALILNPRAARIAELPDFMVALSEWGCDDPNEQAAAITDFLNSLVGLREYLEDSTHLPAKEPADV